MSIGILATQTGNGHISVMNSLKCEFEKQGYNEIECFPTFYEDLMVSNKILSNFYNFLMVNSIPLCEKYCEFTYLTRPDLSPDFYEGVRDNIIKFIKIHNFDTIISVSHTINHCIVRILKELKLENKIKFYIVITDPYEPITEGFAVEGATKYYCANEVVKGVLLKSNIEEDKIRVCGYPINNKFNNIRKSKMEIIKELNFNYDKKIVLINSGSQGIFYYYDFLKLITKELPDLQVIFISGKNSILYQQCSRFVNKFNLKNRVKIFDFVENLQEYIFASDIVITKAGANSFYEVLNMYKPIIIDAVNGFLFQEKGVKKFIDKYKIGEILENTQHIIQTITDMFEEKRYTQYVENIQKLNIKNGCKNIVSDICKNINDTHF
ncbi:hypothetical protein KQI30_13800 [Clostridium bornimense]|uniref:glycosyltransferase n=1 Tax=Clostridium bornimense TaxID=1216932 RepID=UPI001C118DE4|nr:glycosyltransferase [Clostridium bornimense]MBU5317325.1 hypothetical protein [Clostridium bornimense]